MVEPRNFSEFDEDDVRSRPARSTRPRTKDRPDYSKAATAFVVAVDRGRVTCLLGSKTSLQSDDLITAMKSREIGKTSVVVGDTVGLVGDISGEDGTLARMVTVAERKNALTRTVDDDAEIEKIWSAEHSLADFMDERHFKSYDELKRKLEQVLNAAGAPAVRAESADLDMPRAAVKPAPAARPAPKAEADFDEDDESLSYFAKLAADD